MCVAYKAACADADCDETGFAAMSLWDALFHRTLRRRASANGQPDDRAVQAGTGFKRGCIFHMPRDIYLSEQKTT